VTGFVYAPASEIGTVTWTVTNGKRPQIAIDLGPSAAAAHMLFDSMTSLEAFITSLDNAYDDFAQATERHQAAERAAAEMLRLPDVPGPMTEPPAATEVTGPGTSTGDLEPLPRRPVICGACEFGNCEEGCTGRVGASDRPCECYEAGHPRRDEAAAEGVLLAGPLEGIEGDDQ